MSIVIALAVGFIVVRLLLLAGGELLANPVLASENYRKQPLPTAVGLVLVAGVLAVEGGRAAAGAIGWGDDAPNAPRILVLLATVGFGMLGFLDDVLGSDANRGFRGHFRALARGHLTTGMLKLAGGIALALVLATAIDTETGMQPFVDAALIALAANLANLLDRGPGRATKFALLLYIPVAILCGTGATGTAVAVVAGCAAGLLPGDLREDYMLGDTGANVIGAVLGLAVVLEAGTATRAVIVAIVLLAANLASEFVSFSRLIERTPPLRAFDRLGRREDI